MSNTEETSTQSNLSDHSSEDDKQLERINNVIEGLSQELSQVYSNTELFEEEPEHPNDKKTRIMKEIESIILKSVRDIANNVPPSIQIRNTRCWNNCVFDEVVSLKPIEDSMMTEIKFNNRNSMSRFAMIHSVLAKIFKLLATNETCTKRELYYQNIEIFENQSYLDSALNDVTLLLQTQLHELNIYATSKGLVYGPLHITTPSKTIECFSSGGACIPNDISKVTKLETKAKFVLIIEKDAIFEKLIDNNAMKNLPPCLFITAKGIPDINTRILLKKIWDILEIPIFALVDPDPWGIEIMCIYRFGSLTLSHQADQLAVPSIKWLGILPTEIVKLIDRKSPLTDNDRSKINDLLKRPYVISNEKIQLEINSMLRYGYKAETEDIEIAPHYLANVYIPCKLSTKDFL